MARDVTGELTVGYACQAMRPAARYSATVTAPSPISVRFGGNSVANSVNYAGRSPARTAALANQTTKHAFRNNRTA